MIPTQCLEVDLINSTEAVNYVLGVDLLLEAFMEEVSRDADRRFRDKQVRKERAETFKKRALLAFRRGEYEKALTNYDKVIPTITILPILTL